MTQESHHLVVFLRLSNALCQALSCQERIWQYAIYQGKRNCSLELNHRGQDEDGLGLVSLITA